MQARSGLADEIRDWVSLTERPRYDLPQVQRGRRRAVQGLAKRLRAAPAVAQCSDRAFWLCPRLTRAAATCEPVGTKLRVVPRNGGDCTNRRGPLIRQTWEGLPPTLGDTVLCPKLRY